MQRVTRYASLQLFFERKLGTTMRTPTSLLTIIVVLALGTIPAAATQHHRPSYLPPRTVKTIPTITRSAPTTTQPKNTQPGSNNPSAIRVGAKNDSKWLIKNTFVPNERSLLPGQVNYSFVPGCPEDIQNLCVRAAQNNFAIDDNAYVFYFSGLVDIQKFGNGFVRIQQKFLEWKNVAISNNVTKLEKEMTSANFPSRMIVGSVSYKLSAFFVVQRQYEGTPLEKTAYTVEFRKGESDQFNVLLPKSTMQTFFVFNEAGLAKFIELLAPKAAFEKLQALKNKEATDKLKEDLFR